MMGMKKMGRNKISLVRVSAPSPFVVTIDLLAGCHAEPGTTSTFVSNVPVASVAYEGSLDDPEWVKVVAGEVAEGIEGID